MPSPSGSPCLVGLPPELLRMIASHLPDGTLFSLARTTRRIHRLLLSELYSRGVIHSVGAPRTTTASSTTTTSGSIAPAGGSTPKTAAEAFDERLRSVFFKPPDTDAAADAAAAADTAQRIPSIPVPISNLHRALFHALQARQCRPIDLVRSLAPAGLVEPRWLEAALTEAACERDVQFAEFLLLRFRKVFGEALESGRVVHAVLDAAVREEGRKGCFGGVLRVVLQFVGKEGDTAHGVDKGKPLEGLVEKMMAVARNGCLLHDLSEESCFVGMVWSAVDKGMVDLTGVTREQLEQWIGELPEDAGLMVKCSLASARNSPLSWP